MIRVIILTLTLLFSQTVWADKVNINTATAEQIAESLNGIGMSKAQKIVAYRTENGPFKNLDELVLVKGIGLKTIEKNREAMTTGMPEKNEK